MRDALFPDAKGQPVGEKASLPTRFLKNLDYGIEATSTQKYPFLANLQVELEGGQNGREWKLFRNRLSTVCDYDGFVQRRGVGGFTTLSSKPNCPYGRPSGKGHRSDEVLPGTARSLDRFCSCPDIGPYNLIERDKSPKKITLDETNEKAIWGRAS
jgi:hypothetical protein